VEEGKCSLTVAEETRVLEDNVVFEYDPSFLHTFVNSSNEKKAVMLIMDIWHPSLSTRDIAKLEAQKQIF
jgi:hypothetical protein